MPGSYDSILDKLLGIVIVAYQSHGDGVAGAQMTLDELCKSGAVAGKSVGDEL